jgi:hypothetical protein
MFEQQFHHILSEISIVAILPPHAIQIAPGRNSATDSESLLLYKKELNTAKEFAYDMKHGII